MILVKLLQVGVSNSADLKVNWPRTDLLSGIRESIPQPPSRILASK